MERFKEKSDKNPYLYLFQWGYGGFILYNQNTTKHLISSEKAREREREREDHVRFLNKKTYRVFGNVKSHGFHVKKSLESIVFSSQKKTGLPPEEPHFVHLGIFIDTLNSNTCFG